MDVLTYTRKLKEHNVRVIFEQESIDTFAQTGKTMITIFASLAQDYSRNMSENVKWGKEHGYQRGMAYIPCNTFLDYRKNADGEVAIYDAEDTHPAIIDLLKWQEVQDEYERRTAYNGRTSEKNVLIGRVFCECCRAGFGRRLWNSADERYRRHV